MFLQKIIKVFLQKMIASMLINHLIISWYTQYENQIHNK